MEGTKKRFSVRQGVLCAVSKCESRFILQLAFALQEIQICVESDPSQNHDNLHVLERGKFPMQMARAVGDLLR